MKQPTFRTFMGDFETTVYENQESTEVWASAVVEMGSEDVKIFHSIDDTFDYFKSLKCNVKCFYHNLKFDGAFWLSYLIDKLNFKQATVSTGDGAYDIAFVGQKDMPNDSFSYLISDLGQWYQVIIKVGGKIILLQDSLKLLPFSVKRISESFKTKHQKLDIEYKGYRYAGCEITDKEKEYIANDVLVVKEALEMMFADGHNKMTIGSCCLEEFKKTFLDKWEYDGRFPDLSKIEIDEDKYGSPNADAYIRKSYRGGWCYLARGKECQIKHNGTTADVNSLYPSMMSSESGNYYPICNPHFWKGNYIPDEALSGNKYYFIRIKTRFYIKEGKLPFISIKGSFLYLSHEILETSDIRDRKTGEYYTHYKDRNGNIHDTSVILTLTMTDYKLFLEQYEAVNFEILDGCWFISEKGLFDQYMNKYKKIKMESKGAKRELAKLFLNNLYGKMASSTDSSFKYAYQKADGTIGFVTITEYNKKSGYIAIGSAITSYAKNFTIRSAQANYYGKDQRGFIYADTDSIHCDLSPEELKGITVHPTNFCCWKLESQWDEGFFTRQKTYIEHVTHEDQEPIDKPYYNVKCAGLPEKCKNIFIEGLEDGSRKLEDFVIGLKISGKLLPKRIQGGIVLVETTYEMR